MSNREKITKEFLNNLNYPDFVGFINQWNVLPGSYVTLNKWAKFSNMNEKSRLLQVACTTGFQSRELAILTGCSGKAFDLSHEAIKMAKYNKDKYAPKVKIEYFQADGMLYNDEEKFSHVAIGAGIGFFPNPQKALEKSISFLADGGFLLASPFYIIKDIPQEKIQQAKKVFGITPTLSNYKTIMKMYETLEIVYEDRNEIIQESQDELKKYCEDTIKRTCEMYNIKNQKIYETMYNRLMLIKETSNILRPHQNYSVLVLRYRNSTYPNRFVELF